MFAKIFVTLRAETLSPDITPAMTAPLPGILKFAPVYRTVRWGGSRIADFKGVAPVGNSIGESWEVSALPDMLTAVSEGPLEGATLPGLLEVYGSAVMGESLHSRFGGVFPLLVKFIDAEDDLSVQVHPDDNLLQGQGKTELWYIIDARAGATIYSGLNRTLTPEALRRHLSEHTLTDVLARHYPMSGDVFYLPAGRVHSMSGGNFVLEIQQSSDVTYRLWDFDRRDANGQLRELHVEKALEAINLNQTDYGLARPQIIEGAETLVKRTPYFTVTALKISKSQHVNTGADNSFRIVVAVDGAGVITADDGTEVVLRRGQTALVPAATKFIDIRSTETAAPLKLITAFVE